MSNRSLAVESGTRSGPTMRYYRTTSPRRDARFYVEGPWCESHIMAPAVFILNPSNGIHNHRNCRPGWRTSLGSIPIGSALLCACARPITLLRVAPEDARSISRGGALAQCRGFGTCGCTCVGTPQLRPMLVAPPPCNRLKIIHVGDFGSDLQ